MSLPSDLLLTLQEKLEQLPPELQRAAHWVVAHPAEVGLWSMRRQAQALGVAPATMLRLARAVGFSSYEDFRLPFQQALAGQGTPGLRDRAAALQAAAGESAAPGHDVLTDYQIHAMSSVCALNPPSTFDAAVQTLLEARQVGFLGTRSAFGIAFQMRYAYQLVRRNSVLIDGLGGAPAEQADNLGPGDALIVISQAPYPTATVQLARQAAQRGVALIALTDDPLSPLAVEARHTLRFAPPDREGVRARPARQGPGSFFHTTAGLLGLAEHLIARLTARGGDEVLNRLTEVEQRLLNDNVYWSAAQPRRPA
ncbi:MurR/RpiR family transcriptional regulator [Achromobacter insolitus]|jgi:DNA-binding MurR/RpiR family transcriptional regulator|uniref:HTH rpiR-type domain-containing protein n=2 Tax=Achromobacter insolitus TaxID=217204 RepID=A0A6S7FA83_9BURK|nr:MurR/RpiR family transcriptional regulator [Achromobacter insolitus]APX73633.1 silent information regulator protein Sir2 [Achromobacter insolitus]MCP1404369.1 DNA-binding MurR/RpiR family transcriptional regulator [Achromobacter insolitus]MDH3065624.1 MurR/RpiR family transcriptional regulator [Achromobacter insolitus]NGT18551.1 MurR/RpiR family transcriptional regulator [Achromobacter insolitus]OAD17227.1 silent information regulator protein Sir2 [Achromobacter insolitus]